MKSEELEVLSGLGEGKAPGPVDVTTIMVWQMYSVLSEYMLEIYNKCLEHSVFTKVWKKARVYWISKGRGEGIEPSAYCRFWARF